VAAGVIFNRFNASWFGILPTENYFYSPSWMEVAILAGVLSGVLLLFTLITHFFPVFSETVNEDESSSPRRSRSSLKQAEVKAGD
jgi:Ni/Fe-hydrogenase subunit HybB-like protein